MGIADRQFPIPDWADDYANDGVNGRLGGIDPTTPRAERASEAALLRDCLMTNRVHPFFRVGCADTLAMAMHIRTIGRQRTDAAGQTTCARAGRRGETKDADECCF